MRKILVFMFLFCFLSITYVSAAPVSPTMPQLQMAFQSIRDEQALGNIEYNKHPKDPITGVPPYASFEVICPNQNPENRFISFKLKELRFGLAIFDDAELHHIGTLSVFLGPEDITQLAPMEYDLYNIYLHHKEDTTSSWIKLKSGGCDQLDNERVAIAYPIPVEAISLFHSDEPIYVEVRPKYANNGIQSTFTIPKDRLPYIRLLYSPIDFSLYKPVH
ncbi:hypothetical protein [Pectinatus frisingensis]|uniref:hypothetical protein n=1 Tax=Pectinatus frisingensis TaxID=865 RepID=UPI003D80A002